MSGCNDSGISQGGKKVPPPPANNRIVSAPGHTEALSGPPMEKTFPFLKKMLSRGLLRGPRWVWWAAAAGLILGWGLADIRLRGLPWPDRPLEHKTDFTVYTAAGRAFFTGENPYEVTSPRGWKYLYPPLFALLVAPLSLLPMSEQCLVWYLISVGFCWGCYRELGRIVGGLRKEESIHGRIPPHWWKWLGILAFIAALFPTLNCLQRGQVGVLKLYLLLLGVRLIWLSGNWVGQSLGGLSLAGAIVLKLTPALVVAVLLWTQLADLMTQVWRAWRSQVGWRKRGEPLSSETNFIQSPHFTQINTQGTGWNSGFRDREKMGGIARDAFPAQEAPAKIPLGLRPIWGAGRPFLTTLAGVAVGLGGFFFLLPSSLIGWQKNLEHWAQRMLASAEEGLAVEKAPPESHLPLGGEKNFAPANSRTIRNQSLSNALFRMGTFVDHVVLGGPDDRPLDYDAASPNRIDTPIYQAIQKVVRLVLLGLLLLAGGMLGRWGDRVSQAAAFGLGCVGMLVISPVAWGHYFMLLAPGVMFVPLWLLERGGGRSAAWMAGAPAILSVLHYAFLAQLGRIGLLGLGTAAWLLAACILVLRNTANQHLRSELSALDGQGSVPLELESPHLWSIQPLSASKNGTARNAYPK